jgi:hypothetical protein
MARLRMKGKSRAKQAAIHTQEMPFITARFKSLRKWFMRRTPVKTAKHKRKRGQKVPRRYLERISILR